MALAPRVAAHADALFPLLADPAIYTHLDEGPPASLEALRAKFARSEARRSPDGREHWLNWVVFDPAGTAVGMVQATVTITSDGVHDLVGDTNVAYTIGRAHWGRGLARHAVGQMLAMVAATQAVGVFYIRVDRGNEASLRVATALGFELAPNDVMKRKGLGADEVLLHKLAAS